MPDEPQPKTEQWLTSNEPRRREWLLWVIACVPFGLIVAWFWDRGPGLNADDYALYLMHAQAIAEGRPYLDTPLIKTPLNIALTFQPPGLPLFLALVIVLTGGLKWFAIKLAMAAVSLVAVLMPAMYFRRSHGLGIGLGVLGMLSVAWAPHATVVTSDLGFVALVWTVLYLLDTSKRLTWPYVILVFCLASYAMSYRLLGVVLGPTVLFFGLANRERHGLRPLAPAAVWAVGGLTVAVLAWSTVSSQLMLDPMRIVRTLGFLTRMYGRASVEAYLYPFPGNTANDVFHLATLALALGGLALWTSSAWRTAAWFFMTSYAALLMVVYAREGRYLMPLFPLLVFFLLFSVQELTVRVRHRFGRALVERSLVAAAVAWIIASAAAINLLVTEPRSGGFLADLPETQELFRYLQVQGDGARVSFAQPRVLAWATGIHAMELPEASADRALPEFVRLGVTHVVLDRLGLQSGPAANVTEMIAEHPCRFEVSFENRYFTTYRMLPPCEPAG